LFLVGQDEPSCLCAFCLSSKLKARVRHSCRFKATKTDKTRKLVSLLNDKNLFLFFVGFSHETEKGIIATKAKSEKRQKLTKAKTKKPKKQKKQNVNSKMREKRYLNKNSRKSMFM